MKPATISQLLGIPYDLFVIDEAHCIDKWGRGFRKAYSKLSDVRRALHNPCTLALTASASAMVQQRILKSLKLEGAKVFVTGFYRSELRLEVMRMRRWHPYKGAALDQEKVEAVVDLLQRYAGQKVIVYVVTINQGEALRKALSGRFPDLDLYHGQTPVAEKLKIQNAFSGRYPEKIRIVIATSAFGMGIDIPDIRLVIHFSIPSNLEEYYQQIGRAGRDGQPSTAILLYRNGDEKLNEFMLKKSRTSRRNCDGVTDMELEKLESEEVRIMVLYAASRDHWQYILDYFGDKRPATVWGRWLTPTDERGRSVLRWWLLLLLICLGLWLVGLF